MTGKRKKQRQKNRLIEMNKKRLIPGNKKGKGKIRGKKNNVKPRRGGDSMAEKRRMKQPPYVYGTAVEQTVPSRQPGREERNQIRHKRRVSRAVRRNQEKALQMDVPYVLALTVAVMSALYICVSYLQVQSTITGRIHNIEKLEQEVESLKSENDALQTRINISVDLDHIYKVATEELGMVYANRDQVRLYDKKESEYVKQNEDIPKH